MRVFKAIAAVMAFAVIALLGYAATRPDIFRVQRSASIKATPDKLYPLINDIRQFNTWNPFNRKDPSMKGSYRGPAAGPGAAFDFEGNSEVGKGTVSITGGTPARAVNMKLDMTEPMQAHNDIEFLLVPRGDMTDVTWTMQGPCPYLGKLMGVIFDMDKMVGGEFDKGLALLKAQAEKS